MSRAVLISLAALSACAPLRSEPATPLGPPMAARVIEAREVILGPTENAAERAAWGALAAGGLGALSQQFVQDGRFSGRTVHDLTLATAQGPRTVRSLTAAEVGRCVLVRAPLDDDDAAPRRALVSPANEAACNGIDP